MQTSTNNAGDVSGDRQTCTKKAATGAQGRSRLRLIKLTRGFRPKAHEGTLAVARLQAAANPVSGILLLARVVRKKILDSGSLTTAGGLNCVNRRLLSTN